MTTGAGQDRASRERGHRTAIVALVALLLVAMVAVILLMTAKASTEDELDDAEAKIATYEAGPEARAAAEEILLEMTSYDHRRMDGEYAWLERFSNDELRTRFENQVPRLRKVITRSKATAEGEVVQSAYETIDDSTATVLAFVRQRLTDAVNKRGVIEEQWTTMTLVREGEEWLVEEIDIVTVPPPP